MSRRTNRVDETRGMLLTNILITRIAQQRESVGVFKGRLDVDTHD